MATNNDRIVSLKDIFGGNYHITIPSFQRPYCWGGSGTMQKAEKVSDFVREAVLLFRHRHLSTLGLLLGAVSPDDTKNIIVIDGQQRLVTLYLLVGMLFRRTSSPVLRNMLIGGDGILRLQYQGRREVMYFLTDLVNDFFLNRDGRLSRIKQSSWYFNNYDSEPSIMSMLQAIHCIDDVLEQADADVRIDFESLADFAVNELSFMYCTVVTSSADEVIDRYIIGNTTGEPLTKVQTLKALVLQVSEFSAKAIRCWNDMEYRAWMIHNGNNRVDDPLGEDIIYRTITLTAALRNSEESPLFTAEGVDGIFKVANAFFDLAERHILSCESPDFIFLPTLAYVIRFGSEAERFITGFVSYLTNKARYLRPDQQLIYDAVDMARRMDSPDILSILRLKRINPDLLTEEDRMMLEILEQQGERREEVEMAFERGASHPLLNGHLQRPIEWCTDRNGNFSLQRFCRYIDRIHSLWGKDIDCNENLDTLRRALLACRHPGYPLLRKGDSVLSLCWRDYDWQRLMQLSPGAVRQFLDRCSATTPEEIIERFNCRDYPYYFLIKQPNALYGCRKRMLLRPCKPFIGVYDEEKERVRWYVDQRRLYLPKETWTPFRTYGSRCLYSDTLSGELAVDIYYTPGEPQPYRIEIFRRQQSRQRFDLSDFASRRGIRLKFDPTKKRHYLVCANAAGVTSAIGKLGAD